MKIEKRFCPNCGTELRADARFCPECGTKIEEKEEPRIASIVDEKGVGERTQKEDVIKEKKKKKNTGIKIVIMIIIAILLFGLGYVGYGIIENYSGNKKTEKEKENDITKKKSETSKKSNSKKNKDQSFKVKVNGIGDMEFESLTPDTNKSKYADAVFKIKKDGKLYEELPGYEENNIRTDKEFQKVEAVSFRDCNSDDLDDIIIVNSYKKDNQTESEARIYTQGNDQKFTLDKELSSKVNEGVSDKVVDNITKYLESPKETTEKKTEEINEESSSQSAITGWKQAYIDWVNQRADWTYEMLDVNGDSIPELAAIGPGMAQGSYVATYGNNSVQEVQILREGIYYMKGKNALDNESGSMGEYYDRVFKIQNGSWVNIGEGTYTSKDGVPTGEDENGNPLFDDFTYTWNGIEVSEEEYSSKLGSVFNLEEASMVSETGVSASEIISQIQNY